MPEKPKKVFERRFESRVLCDFNRNPSQCQSPLLNSTITTTTTANSTQIWRPWEDPAPNQNIFHLVPHINYSEYDGSNENKAILGCKYCPKRFTRKDNLTRHIKMKHIPRRAFSCGICSKQLSRPDAVARHETSCHKRCKA